MKKFIFTFCLLSFLILTTSVSGQLTYPSRYPTAIIPHANDANRLFFLYNPMQYDDNVGQDTFKLYYIISDSVHKKYLARSVNSGITWTSQIVYTDSTYESIIGNPDYRTQTYYMQVFRNGDDWWGLVGMYRVGNNGGETNEVPYTHPEYTSDVELMWSDDGEKWYRTNNHQPFIALHDSINTIYSVGTVVGDSVYIYSSESTLLHATYSTNGCGNVYYRSDTASYKGKFYSIYLYKIGIDRLNEWRPPTKVKLTATIEGFLNTGTGKLNLRDTLPAELRNSTSPFGLVVSSKSVIDSVTFKTEYEFPHVNPGNYYLTVSGRNSIETWSSSAITIYNDSATTYNFTTGATKAYGGNLIPKADYTVFIQEMLIKMDL